MGRTGPSPRARARIAGAVYLTFFATAVLGALVAPGTSGLGGSESNAAAMAGAIKGHQDLFRLGFALGLISTAAYVALAALFYQLFRPVSRTAALLAVVFSITGCALTAVGSLFQLGALVVLGGDSYLNAFTAAQLNAIALLLINFNAISGSVALVFFGFFQLALGYVIYRSTFLPRILGVLIAVAGVGWLTFLWPPLSAFLLSELEVLGFSAEALLMLWLIVRGVNPERWTEVAAAGA
jgi:hypothetical protein